MSKSKTDATEKVENKAENVETPIENTVTKNIGNQPALLASTFTTPKKYGVVRYLQLYPQNTYVEAAMLFKYKSEVHTIAEWEKLLAKVKRTLGYQD